MLAKQHGSVESNPDFGLHSTHLAATGRFERLPMPSRTPVIIIASLDQCVNHGTISSYQDCIHLTGPRVNFGGLGSRFHNFFI
jgi:hypothetical protein